MAFSMGMPWNEGEEKMQRLLRVPELDNPTSAMLTPQASFMLQHGPLLAIGSLDGQARPWTTLWGGAAGFSEPLGGGLVGTRTLVDRRNDPVVQALLGDGEKEEMDMQQPKDGGKLISGLSIDLMARKRVKFAGRMVAGTIREVDSGIEGEEHRKQDQIQLVTKIEESLGNCPKYLNQYEIRPAHVASKLLSQGPELSDEGRELISNADMFFLSTSTEDDADTNHRGGSPGFVRILSPSQIVYPEYSGNRFYQSLGNLQLNPRIGLTFPNYETGDVLYITGTADVLVGKDAATLLPGSNLALKITIDESRYVARGLPFRGERKTPSSYNPLVRTLASEGNIRASLSSSRKTARLVKKTIITPSIARFTFSVPEGIAYEPGQWVALDFSAELDTGYQHMRNDDPTSLNDDFVRTFTISSAPQSASGDDKEFDITIRKVGPVTKFLFQQNERAGLEVSILGVGGDFKVQQEEQGVTPFIAGGVGITPLLGLLHTLAIAQDRLKLFWTLRLDDVDFVAETLQQYPGLTQCTEIFFTGKEVPSGADEKIERLERLGVRVEKRRLLQSDLDEVEAERWYLCAGTPLRKAILSWLEGKTVVFEDFDY